MSKADNKLDTPAVVANPKCGLIMPISAIAGCSEQHWSDVKSILTETLKESGYHAELVSEADDVGIIQKRIIQNVYENPIVVCDVSGKNPNVMFELGMRLAFDKPTVIVKDDLTDYSFDTSPIEHIGYPRDLRFNKILEFKKKLKDKVKGTYEASQKSSYTTFLKSFGEFKVAKLNTQEVDKEDYLLSELSELKHLVMRGLRSPARARQPESSNRDRVDPEECSVMIRDAIESAVRRLRKKGANMEHPNISSKILQYARRHGDELPPCFESGDGVCRDKFNVEIEGVVGSN